ncbi:DUF3828 domain-containing protein [Tenacibaculum finnmarkense genomovar finnmarkense]|uniref:DUF3828 domain-containing protein n=1 Tax=Tenacibaculum finnmarkense TaxID=2781243 RepID=UPI001E522997|nr:DUF3828 domain-containing protein [Tenacibaculum finnmarkense]MCD8418584.1 YbjP/YqhG family protein [Tenacibaculum finnmarkense genomovar finnmarkense]MCG8186942.1 DUF3828 domain-containing protein [Tenacibaculum finnmarkense genomovar finnmarkense]MCG8203424.1 DUF3828 domain-containing protein [Tenacibaculum finnmarkense genomovar finnmarkense]MCG8210979.1 DUF3828 domain-containing protein [Tenacibaculum finnmarkense genomovar finnmarkense]MCG8213750.1 DUF3828 domain-containing protein [Te
MKKIILYTVFLLIISCKKYSKEQNQENNSNNLQEQTYKNKQIETIREFYLTLYGLESNRTNYELRNKYVSKRILKRMDSLNSEELVLDYDPFIQGQDWDIKEMVRTLEIKPLKNNNEYRVSFYLFDFDKEPTSIDLLLKKEKNGNYLIWSILSDVYLNFKKRQKSQLTLKNKSNNKIFKPFNSNCDIYIYTYGDSLFSIKEQGSVKLKGKLKKIIDSGYSYYNFENFEGIYYNDTLDIENYGNAMNQFIRFQSCDEKYIHFVNILPKGKH